MYVIFSAATLLFLYMGYIKKLFYCYEDLLFYVI
jgi:hypothetical protein